MGSVIRASYVLHHLKLVFLLGKTLALPSGEPAIWCSTQAGCIRLEAHTGWRFE